MIIRELITRLSFDVDRRGIENFNRAIVGFKTQFSLAATAVTGFITGVVKAVSSVSDSILDTDELARSTGIATKELIGLQKAAGQFRISPDQFSSGLRNLNQLIRESQQGFGTLQRLARDGAFEIRGADQSLLSTRQILENILEALGRVEDEASRRDLAKQIFGEERFSDIAKEGVANLNRLAEAFIPLGEKFEENRERAVRFDRSLNRLTDSAKELAFNVFPPLIDALGQTFDGFNEIIKSTREKGFLETASNVIDANVAAFKQFFGFGDGVPEFIKREVERDFGPATRRVEINTSIEIQPPVGTEETQREFFREAAREAFTENFQNEIEKVANNFPITE